MFWSHRTVASQKEVFQKPAWQSPRIRTLQAPKNLRTHYFTLATWVNHIIHLNTALTQEMNFVYMRLGRKRIYNKDHPPEGGIHSLKLIPTRMPFWKGKTFSKSRILYFFMRYLSFGEGFLPQTIMELGNDFSEGYKGFKDCFWACIKKLGKNE